LLKYRDEYSKKSGQSPKNVPPRTEGEGEADTKLDRERDKNYSAEVSDKAADSTPEPIRKPAGSLPLNTGKNFVIFEDQIIDWQETFPAVNVRQQLAEMREWCKANPKKRKTKGGVLRFVVAWLSKEQDNPPKQPTGGNGHVNGNGKNSAAAADANLRAALLNEGINPDTGQEGGSEAWVRHRQGTGADAPRRLGPKPGDVLAFLATSSVREG
jgi:hypothetical protein